MTGRRTKWSVLFVFAISAALSCTPRSDGLVSIRGTVRNVDTGEIATGVRVSLLGTNFADAAPTGSDGAYEIRVPKGSVLYLFADDFDPAEDRWFPLINVDVPAIVADSDIPDWPIHSCPQTVAPNPGSVAIWDNYLANADDQTNGNMFAATSCANSGGIVSIVNGACNGSALALHDSITITSSEPAVPMGYIKAPWFASLDPTLGPDIFYPSSQTVTDPGGWACGFGDSTFAGGAVELTIQDRRPSRNLTWWPQPFECPVRPGTISLVWVLSIDGLPNQTFKVAATCAGLIPASALVAQPLRSVVHHEE